MDNSQLERLRVVMSDFRLAVTDMRGHAGLANFPHGSCRWASFMLAHILADAGEGGWLVRCGDQGPTWLYSHCWLARDSYILDITADQVAGYDGPLLQLAPSPFESVLGEVRTISASDIYDHPPILEAYRQISLAISARAAANDPGHVHLRQDGPQ